MPAHTHSFRFDLMTGMLSGWSWNSDARRWDANQSCAVGHDGRRIIPGCPDFESAMAGVSLSAIVIVALSITCAAASALPCSSACVAYVILPWYPRAGRSACRCLVGRGESTIPRDPPQPGLFVTTAILVAISFVPGCAIEKHRIAAAKSGPWPCPSVERYRTEHTVSDRARATRRLGPPWFALG